MWLPKHRPLRHDTRTSNCISGSLDKVPCAHLEMLPFLHVIREGGSLQSKVPFSIELPVVASIVR